MRKRSWIAPAIAGSLFLATTLAGCGNSDPAYAPAYGGYGDTSMAFRSQSTVGIPQNLGAANSPAGAANAYGGGPNGDSGAYNSTANTTASEDQLTAIVSSLQNGVVLGLGDCVATVLVSNPSSVTLAGTLTVTFMDSGRPTSDVQTMDLSLAAGQAQNFTFTDTEWSTDNATVHITTQAPAPGSGGMSAMGGGLGL